MQMHIYRDTGIIEK